jgi:two-component system response regulator AtoC
MTAAGPRREEPSVGRLLVVLTSPGEREPWRGCVESLQAAGHLVHAAGSPAEALARMAAVEDEIVVLVGPSTGAIERTARDLMARLMAVVPVVVAGIPDGELSRALVREGAWITTPGCEPATLGPVIDRALRFARAIDREARFDPSLPLERMLGSGDLIAPALRMVERAAESPSPVLIVGEVGTGKQIVARAIHSHPRNERHGGPFVKFPLRALSDEAMRQELLGTEARPGVLELAHGGTLFLDDINVLTPPLQALLLDLMSAGREAAVFPADSRRRVPADARLIAGSIVDLVEDPSFGGLREDFHARLTVLPIHLPPLRQRPGDIPVMAGALIDRLAVVHRRTLVGLTPAAASLLQRHHWPGNVRELEEHMDRAVRRSPGPALDVTDLPELVHMTAGRPDAPAGNLLELRLALDPRLPLAETGRRAQVAAEVTAIRRALRETGGNVTHAARLLKVSRMHLQSRMKRYGLRQGSEPLTRSR